MWLLAGGVLVAAFVVGYMLFLKAHGPGPVGEPPRSVDEFCSILKIHARNKCKELAR